MVDNINGVPTINLNYPINKGRDFFILLDVPIEWKNYNFQAGYQANNSKYFNFDIIKSDDDIVTKLKIYCPRETTILIPTTSKGRGELLCKNLGGEVFTVLYFTIDTVCPPIPESEIL